MAVNDVAKTCSQLLEKELMAQGSQPQALLAELNTRVSDALAFRYSEEYYYEDEWGWLQSFEARPILDEACPRTWRRETWTKKAGKTGKVWKSG